MLAWGIVLLTVVVLFLILFLRALALRPTDRHTSAMADYDVDMDAAAFHMQAMLRVPTVSFQDKSHEDDAAFEAFVALLPTLYPRIHRTLTYERIGARALLYRWHGKEKKRPGVFMAHYDVVPADESKWTQPPFDGVLIDDALWGRGALDTKGTLLSILEAVDSLIGEGFVPQNDIYLSFAGDEEIRGTGTPSIVDALTERGVKPAFVLDEGGAVVENVLPGVNFPCALIGVAEKGSMNVELKFETNGGHASTPPPHSAVGVLAQAVVSVESSPFPYRLTQPTRWMLETIGRHAPLGYRIVYANLWLFGPLLSFVGARTGGEINALLRTTCAFTQMEGGSAANVLPTKATMGANLRLIPGDTVESAREKIVRSIGNDAVSVEVLSGADPSPISRTDGEPWDHLKKAIEQTWADVVVSPYLMMAASDAYHYAKVSDSVYRFSPMMLSAEERQMIHGHNERIPVATLHRAILFYRRIMRMC